MKSLLRALFFVTLLGTSLSQDLVADSGRYNGQNRGSSSIQSRPLPSEQQTFTPVRPGGRPPAPQPFPGTSRPAVRPIAPDDPWPLAPAVNMPTIEAIEVACSKDEMTVRIKFDRPFNGIIYSKGFFNNPNCRYVGPSSGRDFYQFTIKLDSCGSQFNDGFTGGGQTYLQNTLILQNEPGIQEVWDTARILRCLWQGNLDKQVTFNFNVDMLEQQVVTFSGDTANAVMDVQIGKGPFAPSVSGLVKIGETMTIVISVDGDPGFDIHVQDCIAHPGDRANSIQLTDSQGCVLKPKLMGAFQTTTQTGNTGATVIAYAFFQAFKFPDQMDVYLECNLELCKGSCRQCPTVPNTPPPGRFGRRKRSSPLRNVTEAPSDPVTLARNIRVVSPEDITLSSDRGATITLASNSGNHDGDICMSTPGFATGLVILMLILIISCVLNASLCARLRSQTGLSAFPSSTSFHPFALFPNSKE